MGEWGSDLVYGSSSKSGSYESEVDEWGYYGYGVGYDWKTKQPRERTSWSSDDDGSYMHNEMTIQRPLKRYGFSNTDIAGIAIEFLALCLYLPGAISRCTGGYPCFGSTPGPG